ncbi:MAG: peptidylprolyl isomerase [Bdellovibrionales bacterium RIFCSPHIGHO2_01_FULL_40_29]|nr:MAG: peptidylprolyl isomerase [Bdellovibrionales bacterium RIFCSPHIGHO2_01_FULL_40_29]OFZ34182.1 MAG: peptidylprolyl isomerase [Bdellovibrionales bacterium RIFCSPHIGHO2_02_FULL_40_15]
MKFYHVHHILVNHRFEAEDLLKKLTEGKTLQELAKKFSTCSSSANHGDLGPIALGKADPNFEEAALQLKPGEITKKPIRSRFGFHIILRIS